MSVNTFMILLNILELNRENQDKNEEASKLLLDDNTGNAYCVFCPQTTLDLKEREKERKKGRK